MNTRPVYDGTKPAPAFARVTYADALGRAMPGCWDQFRTRRAACVYWWMLARESVPAFLPDENGCLQPNTGLCREAEPQDMRAAIDQAQHEYQTEGAEEDEGAHWNRLYTAWTCTRSRA